MDVTAQLLYNDFACKAHQDLSNFKTWFVASLVIKSEIKDNPFKTRSVSEIRSSRLLCKILKPPRTLKFWTQFAFPRVKAENAKISRLIVLERKRGKNCIFFQNCSDLVWEKIVLVFKKNFWNSRFGTEGREFANILRSLEQSIQTVEGQLVLFLNQNPFLTCFRFLEVSPIKKEFKLEKIIGI